MEYIYSFNLNLKLPLLKYSTAFFYIYFSDSLHCPIFFVFINIDVKKLFAVNFVGRYDSGHLKRTVMLNIILLANCRYENLSNSGNRQ